MNKQRATEMAWCGPGVGGLYVAYQLINLLSQECMTVYTPVIPL